MLRVAVGAQVACFIAKWSRGAASGAGGPITSRLHARVAAGVLAADAEQQVVATRLDKLAGSLETYAHLRVTSAAVGRALEWAGQPAAAAADVSARPADMRLVTHVPRGIYLWGSVGCGKTMLLDTLYDHARGMRIAAPSPVEVHDHMTALQAADAAAAAEIAAPQPLKSGAHPVAGTAHAPPPMPSVEALAAAWTTIAPPAALPQTLPVRRVHFHKFMQEIHARIHAWKQELLAKHGRDKSPQTAPERDAIAHIARQLSAEAWLLCFDEFQVTDIADALIIDKLFTTMFRHGVVVAATSNTPPDGLYADGLNRDYYFLPFLDKLKAMCRTAHLHGRHDYRRAGASLLSADTAGDAAGVGTHAMLPLFAVGAQADSRVVGAAAAFEAGGRLSLPPPDDAGLRVEPFRVGTSQTVELPFGRHTCLRVLHRPGTPRAASGARAVLASFDDLCGQALGPGDYAAIARSFDTVFLYGLPRLRRRQMNEARRLVCLVDELYDHRCNVVIGGACHVDDMFAQLFDDDAEDGDDEDAAAARAFSAAAAKVAADIAARAAAETQASRAAGAVTADAADTADAQPADPAGAHLSVSERAPAAAMTDLRTAVKRAQSRIIEMCGAGYEAKRRDSGARDRVLVGRSTAS